VKANVGCISVKRSGRSKNAREKANVGFVDVKRSGRN